MWNLANLIDWSQNNQAHINGKWVPAKPIPDPLPQRLKDALQVLLGRADAFRWPEQPPEGKSHTRLKIHVDKNGDHQFNSVKQ